MPLSTDGNFIRLIRCIQNDSPICYQIYILNRPLVMRQWNCLIRSSKASLKSRSQFKMLFVFSAVASNSQDLLSKLDTLTSYCPYLRL